MMQKAVCALALAAALLTPFREAHAYLDPGTGSILLQALIGTVAAGLVAGRLYWDKLRRFLSPSERNKAGGPERRAGEDE